MNPAAEASLAPSGEYTRVLTMAVEYVKPAAKKPTTFQSSASNPKDLAHLILTAT